MKHHGSEPDTIATLRIAAEGMGGVPGEQINFTGAQGREPFRCRQRSVLNLVRITEEGGGHGPTDVDIEPGVRPLCTEKAEAWNLAAHTTEQLTPLLHKIQP